MRNMTVKCDRCSGEVKSPDNFDVLAIQGTFINGEADLERTGPAMIVDLCSNCRSLLMDFLDKPKPDTKENT